MNATSTPENGQQAHGEDTATNRDSASPSYTAAIAGRIGVLMAERRPLTVDQLGTIAAVLDCDASDLLPNHLGNDRSVITEPRPLNDTHALLADDDSASPLPGEMVHPGRRHHADWCELHNHSDEEAAEYGPGPCFRTIAGGWVPEVNRCQGNVDIPFTRELQPSWGVHLEQRHFRGGANTHWVDDPVVVVTQASAGHEVWRLLPGEARELAAALLAGADRVLFR